MANLDSKCPFSVVNVGRMLGLTVTGLLAGQLWSSSTILIPALSKAPGTVSTRQWKQAYDMGVKTGLPASVISMSAWAYVTMKTYKHGLPVPLPVKLTCLAGIATLTIVPWTLFFMKPINARLTDLSCTPSKPEAVDETEVTNLLNKWQLFNSVRASLITLSFVLGIQSLIIKP